MSINFNKLPDDVKLKIFLCMESTQAKSTSKEFYDLIQMKLPLLIKSMIPDDHPAAGLKKMIKDHTKTSELIKDLKPAFPYPVKKTELSSFPSLIFDLYEKSILRQDLKQNYAPFFDEIINQEKKLGSNSSTDYRKGRMPEDAYKLTPEEAKKFYESEFRYPRDHFYCTKKNITKIPDCVCKNSSLKKLALQENQIQVLPKSINAIKELNELKLHNNQIIELPDEIGDLKKLSGLWLFNNKIENIPKTIGQLSELEYFIIRENKIKAIPSELGALRKLKFLSLGNNSIAEIPGSIGYLSSLESLKLNDNKLTTLPPELSKLRNTRINITSNPIIYLPSQLKDLAKGEFSSTVFDLDADLKMLENNEKLPKRLSILVNKSSQKTLMNEMKQLRKIENSFENAGNQHEVLLSILKMPTNILHEQQIIEVALSCLSKYNWVQKNELIEKIAKQNNLTKSEANELLYFHPTDERIIDALRFSNFAE